MARDLVKGALAYVPGQYFGDLSLEMVLSEDDFAGIEILKQKLIKYFKGKIAHIMFGLGIIRHWTRPLG